MPSPPANQRLPKALRIRAKGDFDRAYQQGISRRSGPLIMHALPNELPYSRLGMSVSRRVGNAVRRNRIRRLLREAYRLERAKLPAGYDVVITVRPHGGLELDDCRRRIVTLLGELDDRWRARRRKRSTADEQPDDDGE